MKKNSIQASISGHTFSFARSLIRSIENMAADDSYAADNTSYREEPFSSSFGMTAIVHFSGTVEGDYILSLDETTAAGMIGMHRPGPPETVLKKMREEYGGFIKELLNLAAAQAVSSLESDVGYLSYSPPVLVYGYIEFPAILSGCIAIRGKKGDILCGFSLNYAKRRICRRIEQIKDELEKKKFENEEIQKKLCRILKKIPCGIAAVDSKCRILPKYSKIMKPQIRSDSILAIESMCLAEILELSPEDASNLENWVEMVFSYYTVFDFEKILKMGEENFTSRNGRIFKMNWIPVPNRRTEQLDHLQVVIEDITEKRHLEAEIKEKEKLKKQLRNIGKMEVIAHMAGGICHDFNNIIMGIQGNTELCLLYGIENDKCQKKLKQVLNACNIGKSMVSQLLTVSREQKDELSDVSIIPAIKETLSFFRSVIPPGVTLRQSIGPVSAVVKSNPAQIHQILMNLCINAAHAMEKNGGILTVALEKIYMEKSSQAKKLGLEGKSYIRLTVSDTGCGMDTDVAEKIFDPFFTTKKKGKGSGIGLSVVYTLVKNHDGAVRVYSYPGKGTTFHVFLPESGNNEDMCDENGSDDIPGGDERILVTDDEPLISYFAYETLTELGYQVKTVSDSEEALTLFRSDPQQFDLMITDQIMPSMNGVELAEKMIEIRPDIPVILCSGFARSLLTEEINNKSIRDFIMKPYSKDRIARTVRRVLDS